MNYIFGAIAIVAGLLQIRFARPVDAVLERLESKGMKVTRSVGLTRAMGVLFVIIGVICFFLPG